jgi:hypothetical protein
MKKTRREWFMIWAELGFSAAIIGVFYVLAEAFLFGWPIYEDHPAVWIIGMGVGGTALGVVGGWRRKKRATQAAEAPAVTGEDVSAESGRDMAFTSLDYWGVMLCICTLLLAISCTWRQQAPPSLPPLAKRPVLMPVQQPPATNPEPKLVVAAPAPPPKLKVQALILDRKTPTVIIEGRTYLVGDSVEGAEILTIGRDFMTVKYDGATNIFPMPW